MLVQVEMPTSQRGTLTRSHKLDSVACPFGLLAPPPFRFLDGLTAFSPPLMPSRGSFTAGFLNQGGALVHVYLDGTVLVSHGGTEMGQGLHTKVCQVVANEFGIDVDKVCQSVSQSVSHDAGDGIAMVTRNIELICRSVGMFVLLAGWLAGC